MDYKIKVDWCTSCDPIITHITETNSGMQYDMFKVPDTTYV